MLRTTSTEALSPLTYTVGSPSPLSTKPITGPLRAATSGGPWSARTAVTFTDPPSCGRASTTASRHGRTDQLSQHDVRTRPRVVAGRVERGVGEQPQAAVG